MSRRFDTTIPNVGRIYDSLLGNGPPSKRATVPVGSLLPANSPRSHGEDDEHIQRLAESGAELPPILVQQETMRVIDGMHRLRAAILNGRHSIEVEFFDGCDEEAFIRAVEQNVAHGLPLTLADRKAAAARILGWRPALSDRSVASKTGLSPKTVGAIRARASEEIPHSKARQGRDRRLRPLDSSEGRLRAAEVIRGNPGASLREIAASAGISTGTARSVQARLRAGDDPVQDRPQRSGRTVKQPAGSSGSATKSSATADAGGPSLRDPRLVDEISKTAVDRSDGRWSIACKLVKCLTEREYEIFLMLGEGLDNRRISSVLAVSQRTVKFHVTGILRKLEVDSRLQAGLAAAEYSRLAGLDA